MWLFNGPKAGHTHTHPALNFACIYRCQQVDLADPRGGGCRGVFKPPTKACLLLVSIKFSRAFIFQKLAIFIGLDIVLVGENLVRGSAADKDFLSRPRRHQQYACMQYRPRPDIGLYYHHNYY